MPYVPVAELKDYVGKELGRSPWLTIDQERINLFAEATGDFQFIHVRGERSRGRLISRAGVGIHARVGSDAAVAGTGIVLRGAVHTRLRARVVVGIVRTLDAAAGAAGEREQE